MGDNMYVFMPRHFDSRGQSSPRHILTDWEGGVVGTALKS